MRVAMDIGVIRDCVFRVYPYFWHAGYNVWKGIYLERHRGTLGPLRRGESDRRVGDFVSQSTFASSAAV